MFSQVLTYCAVVFLKLRNLNFEFWPFEVNTGTPVTLATRNV